MAWRISVLPFFLPTDASGSDPDRFNALTVAHAAAGIEDNLLAFFQSFQDLGFRAAGSANLDESQMSAVTGGDEAPPIAHHDGTGLPLAP